MLFNTFFPSRGMETKYQWSDFLKFDREDLVRLGAPFLEDNVFSPLSDCVGIKPLG